MSEEPRLTELERGRRAAAADGRLIDMVSSDFRAAGVTMDEARYRSAWKRWRAEPAYRPDARGGRAAREAIARWMTADGLETAPGRVVVTAGSSLSYRLLFDAARSLAGGAVRALLPRPGYPIFEEIARASGVEVRRYRCLEDRGWIPDVDEICRSMRNGPGIVVVISPNNPTGATYDGGTLEAIVSAASANRWIVVSDEVFSLFRPTARLARAAESAPGGGVVATINGLSKLCAAPEVKLGWICFHGTDRAVRPWIDAIAFDHDLYLTVSGFAEAAACTFLDEGGRSRELARSVVLNQMGTLTSTLEGIPALTPVPPDGHDRSGGIHRIVELSAAVAERRFGTIDDDEVAADIVRRSGVYLHPGYLYGVEPGDDGSPRFVVTGLRRPELTRAAGRRLAALLGG